LSRRNPRVRVVWAASSIAADGRSGVSRKIAAFPAYRLDLLTRIDRRVGKADEKGDDAD